MDANESDLHHNAKPMPSPPAMPIIGHLHLLRNHQHNPWDGFDEIRQQYGDVVSLTMGVHPMVLVSNFDTMKEILLKKGDIFSNRPNFPRHHIVFGGDKENSLALCNYSHTHRDRRKLCKRGIVPNRFSSRNQLLEQIISESVAYFIKDILNQELFCDEIEETEGREEEYYESCKEYPLFNQHNQSLKETNISQEPYFIIQKEDILFLTSDIFMKFLCNEERPHTSPKYKEFVYGCDFVFWDINQSYLIDFLPFLTTLGVGYFYLRRLKNVTDFLRSYIDEQIFEPRLKYHSNSDLSDDNSDDYLDSLILEYLAKTSSMSLADYKVGFADLLAGHAAVANILIRLLGHLSLDQDIQDKICEEAEKAEVHNLTHRPALPYTEAAMQEALRIASSPIVPHVAREDTCVDKFFVPAGTMVLFNVHHLNLSQNLWKDPYLFEPSRFLKTCDDGAGGTTTKLNIPKHFMPFSVGLRQCLGYKMVESTTIMAVANLCKQFIIKADDEDLVKQLLTPKGSIALDPDADCFALQLYPRSINS